MHNVLTTSFELRTQLPTTSFKLNLKSSLNDHGDTSAWITCTKFYSKHNETLLHMLHTKVHVLAIYARYATSPTKLVS